MSFLLLTTQWRARTTDTADSSFRNGRKLQLPLTSDGIFMSLQPAGQVEGEKEEGKEKKEADFKEFDAVASSGTLQHAVSTYT